jgi:hypothetical protein
MPTLLERVQSLQGHIAGLESIDVERMNFEKLETRANQVHMHADTLAKIADGIANLQTCGIPLERLPRASKGY